MTNKPLIVTRPTGDAASLIEALQTHGIETIPAPLIEIAFCEDLEIPELVFQAILVTSANGCRVLGRSNAGRHLRDVLTIAVGEMSAATARAIGQVNVEVAGGDVAALIAKAIDLCERAGGPLLYISGAQTTGDLEARLSDRGHEVHRIVGYEAVAAEKLSAPAQAALANHQAGGVVLYSPRTADIWCRLVSQADLMSEGALLTHYCLSENVASVIRGAFGSSSAIVTADKPTEREMIATILDAERARS